ncbi:MAG TPA: PA domain-containing protein [Candidatus Polarisedimenticolaceae bacterium]|nr:PA domain-containing protein [Candidatus Polarisedimenticolaceae bacterium]
MPRPRRSPVRWTSALALAAGLAAAGPALRAEASIVLNVVDPDGVGFNDPTPVDPVPQNPGTTLGEQRRIVFERAAELWGSILDSDSEIVVQAAFRPLPCTAGSGLLASAGSVRILANFPGAPFDDTWYQPALANKLAGYDLTPGPPDPGLLADPFNDDLYLVLNLSVDDDPQCLGGAGWYYGLDNRAGSRVDLINVLMHELAHGFGFANFVDETTGAGPAGYTDAFSRHTLDNTTGLHWHEMTDAQRSASATRSGEVVWDGPHVRAEAPHVLGPAPVLEVIAPAEGAGTYEVTTATFGAEVDPDGVPGELVLAFDAVGTASDACEELVGDYTGAIVVVDRGSCSFTDKAARVQQAGGAGIVVVNDRPVGLPPMTGQDETIAIPAVGLSAADGAHVREAMPGATGVIGFDESRLAGTDAARNVRLYAEPAGSSAISHWDLTASPSLLMEPVFHPDLESTETVDLTSRALADLGWDACPDSDFSPDVWIGDCDPGVANRVMDDGCTIVDVLAECALGASLDRKCLTDKTKLLVDGKVLESRDRAAIRQCATGNGRPPRGERPTGATRRTPR